MAGRALGGRPALFSLTEADRRPDAESSSRLRATRAAARLSAPLREERDSTIWPSAATPYDREMIDNELVVRRFYDLFNAGDVEAAAGLYAHQCEWEFPAFGAVCRSRREVRDVYRSWK